MNPASILRLKSLLSRELSSLLSYLSGAWPWAGVKEQALIRQLDSIAAEEQAAQQQLGNALRKMRVVPPNGRFPMDFTTMHYVAVDFVLPKLVAEQEGLIAAAAGDAAQVDADARPLIEAFVELKKRHLDALQRLAADHAGAKAVSTLR